MTSNHIDYEVNDIEAFDVLQSEYQAVSKELPDLAIDRQIIAAAHRELTQPQVRQMPKNSWWRRLSLSLSVAAAFSFMVVATHWFWPAPARVLPGTGPNPVTFEIMQDNDDKAEPTTRARRELPEYEPLLPVPEKKVAGQKVNSDSDLVVLDSENSDNLGNTGHPEVNSESTETSSLSTRSTTSTLLDYPSQDAWAREIVELFKKGKYEAGRKEMVRFKQAYPGYPIDEQLKVLRR